MLCSTLKHRHPTGGPRPVKHSARRGEGRRHRSRRPCISAAPLTSSPCLGGLAPPPRRVFAVEQRILGSSGIRVGAVGLGCMGMSDFYGPTDDAESLATMNLALDRGVNLRDPTDATKRRFNGRPEYVRSACDASLKRLGVDVIDLYYQHRVDPEVPIEETVGAMSRLVEQGKVRYLGLCEAGAKTIR